MNNYHFFLQADLTKYIGEWVAICKSRVVSHGTDVKRVYAEAKRKFPEARPLLARVPGKETMIF